MCFDTLNPGGEVRGCSDGLQARHARNITICVYRSSYQVHRSSRNKEMPFQAGVFRMRWNVSCLLNVGQRRPSVRVRSCRMWFRFDQKDIS